MLSMHNSTLMGSSRLYIRLAVYWFRIRSMIISLYRQIVSSFFCRFVVLFSFCFIRSHNEMWRNAYIEPGRKGDIMGSNITAKFLQSFLQYK